MNENHLVFDLMAKWAGNPNITLVLKLLYFPIKFQVKKVWFLCHNIHKFSSKIEHMIYLMPLLFVS